MQFISYTSSCAGEPLKAVTQPLPSLKEHELLVAITHCGVCRSDLHFIHNNWQDSHYPLVPGHEIIGQVVQVGSKVSRFQLQERVGVSWQTRACGHCEWCKDSREELCFELEGIGIGHAGGFANFIIINEEFTYRIPENLPSAKSAPLLCAGSIVFNALNQFHAKPGMKIGILGIGGLGHLAIQFAAKMGCHVTAFPLDLTHADEMMSMGAERVIASHDAQTLFELKHHFDLIISTIDSEIDYQPFIDALRPLGAFCFAGIPTKKIELCVFSLIIGQKIVGAVPLGSHHMIQRTLDFAAEHDIRAKIELMPMSQVNEALGKLANNEAHYRIVLVNE